MMLPLRCSNRYTVQIHSLSAVPNHRSAELVVEVQPHVCTEPRDEVRQRATATGAPPWRDPHDTEAARSNP